MIKKFVSALALVGCVCLASCNNDAGDLGEGSTLEKDYLTIENATYNAGTMPAATTSTTLQGVEMSSQVMNGAMNYITVNTPQTVEKFYIAIKGVEGYYEYIPTTSRATNSYVIPVMISDNYEGSNTLVLSGELANGEITTPFEQRLEYLETMPGAIEVKLAFSNEKDIDIHLFTPSGEHIYYGEPGGEYETANGVITYGLDVDSNAGCSIDGINKENIYIPTELVENGEYTVVVDMYENCDPSIATEWSVVTRYNGRLVTPTFGKNPASGVYEKGAGEDDMSVVMKFRITDAPNGTRAAMRSDWKFTPKPLSEASQRKLDFKMD